MCAVQSTPASSEIDSTPMPYMRKKASSNDSCSASCAGLPWGNGSPAGAAITKAASLTTAAAGGAAPLSFFSSTTSSSSEDSSSPSAAPSAGSSATAGNAGAAPAWRFSGRCRSCMWNPVDLTFFFGRRFLGALAAVP